MSLERQKFYSECISTILVIFFTSFKMLKIPTLGESYKTEYVQTILKTHYTSSYAQNTHYNRIKNMEKCMIQWN